MHRASIETQKAGRSCRPFSLWREEFIPHRPANSAERVRPATERSQPRTKTFFSVLIDRMFTVFVAPLFTKLFDRRFRDNLAACLSHACNAD